MNRETEDRSLIQNYISDFLPGPRKQWPPFCMTIPANQESVSPSPYKLRISCGRGWSLGQPLAELELPTLCYLFGHQIGAHLLIQWRKENWYNSSGQHSPRGIITPQTTTCCCCLFIKHEAPVSIPDWLICALASPQSSGSTIPKLAQSGRRWYRKRWSCSTESKGWWWWKCGTMYSSPPESVTLWEFFTLRLCSSLAQPAEW